MNEETVFIQQEDGINIDNPGGIIYVNQNATGNNDGTSWENAYTDLQLALEAAQAEDQVWVAAGTYYPTDDDDRDRSFVIKTGIEVYGGFAGGETELAQRNWINNPTILSGNIGDLSDSADNSYHVVTITDTSFFTIFDGFNVIEGQADGTSSRGSGGAVYANFDGNADLRNLTIANNISNYGGGIYLNDSDFNLTNVAFFNNNANISGGGLYTSSSTGEVNNSLFVNNRSADGGAIGTAFVEDEGIDITNGTFASNQADSGGVIFSSSIGTNGNGIKVENSIISQNPTGNGNLFVVDDNNITIDNSIVQGGFDGSGTSIIDADPLFINPANNNYSLQLSSPALDAGNNGAVEGISTDLIGNTRIANSTVDLGAYEVEVVPTENNGSTFVQLEEGINVDNPGEIIYVNQNATGNNDGTSWENAYTDLQSALAAAQAEDQVWVAGGTYYPTDDSDRDESFVIKTGIEVYGGFAGGETELAQRDYISNPTILSGNIGNQSDRADNSYHVVTVSDTSFFTVVDGFTIIDGQADGSSSRGSGGAIYANSDGNADLSNLIVANNISNYGGGVYLASSDFNLTNVAFFNNNANVSGGGIYTSSSTGEITNSLFVNNRSADGGAIGTAFVEDEGIEIINGTFADNQADSASVIFSSSIGSNGNGIDVENSIISQNPTGDGNLFVVDDNNITVDNSIIQGGFDGSGTGIIDADPLFIDPANNNYSLQSSSPGIDAGDNTAIEGIGTDLVGNSRITNDIVDLGAYELVLTSEDINDNPATPPEDNPDTPPEDNPNPVDLEGDPVYRFFIPDTGVHFYTADEAERDEILETEPDYVLEGSPYNSAPADDSLPSVDPIYRFLNTDTGVRIYTISEVEREAIETLPNYQAEGIAYYGFTEQLEDTIPVFRFYNPVIDAHFYTSSTVERDSVLENLPDYQLESNGGIAFYVEPSDGSEIPISPPPSEPDPIADFNASEELAAILNGLI